MNRRDLLRYSAAAAVATATAAGVANLAAPGLAASDKPTAKDDRDFELDYKGKKIKGTHDKANKKHKVTINGKKLAVMELELPAAEDSAATITAVISALTHYEPFQLDEKDNRQGLKKLAQKAVDVLGDEELTPLAGEDHEHGR
ncbi:tyrosinase family oxidase copper chaperone [Pilimelia columellifera]